MNVLVGCEFSGRVRDAFTALGHFAVSCDLLPSETPGHHYQGDVFDAIESGVKWDLGIFHPACTFTAVSGNRWMKNNPERERERRKAIKFFMRLWNCNIPAIAMEQPISVMSSAFRKADQVIQPWMFGHGEVKATCLWVRGLPLLRPTRRVSGRVPRVHHEPPGKDRQKNRSRTYTGIARAMAQQWGSL